MFAQINTPTVAAQAATPVGQWSQQWQHVFFAHWQLPAAQIRPHVPKSAEIDLWENSAWVSVIAFRLDLRFSRSPAFVPAMNFRELNLRTYVTYRGEPAIQFFRLYANSWIGLRLARIFTPLPYAYAKIDRTAGGMSRYDATRSDGMPLLRAGFQTAGKERKLERGSLDAWLLERYGAVVPGRNGRLFRMSVQHPPWKAADVSGEISATGLGDLWGWDLSRRPDCCHFSTGVEATVLPFT